MVFLSLFDLRARTCEATSRLDILMYSTLSYKGVGGVQTHIDALCLLFYIFESILGRCFSMSDEAGGQVMIASCWGTTTQTEGLAAGKEKKKLLLWNLKTLCTLCFPWIRFNVFGYSSHNWSIFFFIYRNCRLNRWAAAQKACLLSCFLTLFNSRCQRRRLVVSIVWKQNCLLLQMLWQSKSSLWWAYIRYNKLYIYNQQQQINLKSRSNRGLQKKYENVILLQDERSSEKDFLYLCYL